MTHAPTKTHPEGDAVTLPYQVEFRGHPACPCQATWLPAFEAEAQRRGIINGPLPLSQLIGGAVASGGTHASGGADDTYPLTSIHDVTAYVALSRQMGADATWLRPYNWDGRNGVAHVHRVLTGCPHNGPARYQIAAVQDGYNGLGSGGRGAPDIGPRPLSGRTWQQGIAWAQQQAEEHEMTPEQATQLTQILNTVTRQEDRSIRQTQRVMGATRELKQLVKDNPELVAKVDAIVKALEE